MRLKLVLPITVIAVAGIAGCSSTTSSSSSSSPAPASSSASPSSSSSMLAGYTEEEAVAFAKSAGKAFGEDGTFTEQQAKAIAVCAWAGITTTIPHDEYVAYEQDATSTSGQATSEKIKGIGKACAQNPEAYAL